MNLLKKSYLLSFAAFLMIDSALAMESDPGSSAQIRRSILRNFVEDSQKYSREHPVKRPAHQSPRATVVSCSDSRCQVVELDQTPEEDLFVIRAIGNQVKTTGGSIWYGVEHLESPLLLILGHSDCGAVKAKLDGTEQKPDLPQCVKDELKHVHVGETRDVNEAILANVHFQVDRALEQFPEQVKSQDGNPPKLTIMGAIYDFRDDFGRGPNALIIVNINGEKKPRNIAKHPDLQGSISAPIVGVGQMEKRQ